MLAAMILLILALLVGLLFWAQKVERQRRLVCQVFSRLLDTRRTWKFRITSASRAVMTLGKVVVSGRMAVCLRTEQVVVNAGPLVLPPRERFEFDLEPSVAELLERLGPPGQGDPATVLDLGFEISYLALSKPRKRTLRCIALCDHRGLLSVLGTPAPAFSGGAAPRAFSAS
jgi:autotransporter translocation and assembly factor TamB